MGPPLMHLENLTDKRRGIAFSFLEDQIEKEKVEVDKTLLEF